MQISTADHEPVTTHLACLLSTCWADSHLDNSEQLGLLGEYAIGDPLKRCDEILQAAEQHHDVHLLANAYSTQAKLLRAKLAM